MIKKKKNTHGRSYSRKKITINKKNPESLALGDFSIVAKESGRLTHKQLDSLRRALLRKLKKEARV
jgi:ribosomal protein L16/L10AE